MTWSWWTFFKDFGGIIVAIAAWPATAFVTNRARTRVKLDLEIAKLARELESASAEAVLRHVERQIRVLYDDRPWFLREQLPLKQRLLYGTQGVAGLYTAYRCVVAIDAGRWTYAVVFGLFVAVYGIEALWLLRYQAEVRRLLSDLWVRIEAIRDLPDAQDRDRARRFLEKEIDEVAEKNVPKPLRPAFRKGMGAQLKRRAKSAAEAPRRNPKGFAVDLGDASRLPRV